MSDTHGSASEPGALRVSLFDPPPTLRELDRMRPAQGTALHASIDRARAERRSGKPVVGGFDNKA